MPAIGVDNFPIQLLIRAAAGPCSLKHRLNRFPIGTMLLYRILDFLVRKPWELMMQILNIDRIVHVYHASISLSLENLALCHRQFFQKG